MGSTECFSTPRSLACAGSLSIRNRTEQLSGWFGAAEIVASAQLACEPLDKRKCVGNP